MWSSTFWKEIVKADIFSMVFDYDCSFCETFSYHVVCSRLLLVGCTRCIFSVDLSKEIERAW